ncbi:cellulose biosynthesis cyclic di-GMP-binding regulatory protein BcsB [Shigella flexneri]
MIRPSISRITITSCRCRDLRTFANAGFPFTRMADFLRHARIVMPKKPSEEQFSTLLNTVAVIGGQSGLR